MNMTQITNQGLNTKKGKAIEKVKKIVVTEGSVVFIGLSIFAGSSVFLQIVKESLPVSSVSLQWVSIAITILLLPKVFSTLQRRNDPILIRFARGFREGFLGVQLIIPNASQWIISAKKFVAGLREPMGD